MFFFYQLISTSFFHSNFKGISTLPQEISALANRIAYLSASVPALAANAAGNGNQDNQATAALGKLAATLQVRF